MAQPMKVSILIGADASGAKAGAAEAQRALGGVSKAANDAGASINRLIGETTGLNRAFASVDTRGEDIAAYGAQLDALRARFNPMFATISRYRSEVEAIRAAHRVGAISSAEMAAAIGRERQATLASIDAIKGRNAALRTMPAANNNVAGFQTSNIAAQFQDIGVTAAMGMSPLQIALQQGTQLSAVFAEMQNPIRGVGAALMSLISPTSLVTIGLVGLTAAALQYFTSVPEEASAASNALGNHEEFVRRLRAAYGDAVVGLRDYAAESKKLLEQETRDRIALYQGVLNSASTSATGDLLGLPADAFEGKTKIINDIDSAIQRLQDGMKAGRPDLRAFVEALVDVENHPATPQAIKEIAKEIRESAKEGLEAQSKLEPLIGIFNGVGNAASQQVERVNALSEALRSIAQFGLPQLTEAEKLRKDFEAALAGPAGATEAGVRQLEEAYRRARERLANENPIIANSNGAMVPVPTPGTRPSDLDFNPNEEATQKLNALLEENVQRLQQQRDATRDYLTSQNESIERLQLEIGLVGASASERSKAIAAFEAEQKIRELGILTMGREAEMIRANAQARAELQLQLERQQAAYQSVQQAGSTMIDQLTVGTGTLKDRLKAMAETLLTTFQQLAVANPLKNMLLGTNMPTLTDLFTGKTASPIGATTTGAMTVTAGTVMINGVPLGTNPAVTSAGQLLNPANNNVPAAANINGVRPDLLAGGVVNPPATAPAATVAGSGVDSQVWNYWAAKGLPPHQIAGIMGNMKAESNFNPAAVGDGGHALGLAQWNDRGPAMQAYVGQDWRTNTQGQLDFMNHEFQTTESAAWTRLRASTDVQSATAAMAGYERPSGFSLANPEGSHNWTGRLNGAEQAMQKFGQTTASTTSNLSTLGNTSTKLDTTFSDLLGNGSTPGAPAGSNYFPPAPAAPTAPTAEPQSMFGSLFGGLGKMLQSLTSGIGSIFKLLLGGLFANGGAFNGGTLIPFANGGVVGGPTMFAMSGGRMGVMGEAGPEAIMPLERGAGGKLGVRASIPRGARQGNELRVRYENHHTLNIYGTGDKELLAQADAGVRMKIEESENRMRNAMPDFINEYSQNRWARTSG